MLDYMWRVVMTDQSGKDPIIVALFLLQSDAHKWALKESEEENSGSYTVFPPKKSV